MQNSTRYILVLVLGIFIGAGITIEHAVRADRAHESTKAAPLPLKELSAFSEVFARIQNDYVEPVDNKTILKNAISGMLSGLDPHSSYLDPAALKDMEVRTRGRFGGLGIEVTMENGFVKVVTPIDDTPAARAGIRANDIIVRLNNKPVKGMTLNDAVAIMRGKPGTSILLTIVRNGESKPIKIRVTRAIIKINSVKHKLLEKGFGYIRITTFSSNTTTLLHAALGNLKEQNKGPLKGLVLDLRNNPGGVLQTAVTVSDTFIDGGGLIVYTEGRTADADQRFTSTPGDRLNGAPIIVLINGGSASASEIVAGALQDHRRAIILGTRSFGKGSVQTIMRMSNGGALKLTTARYFTPKGRSIQASGIEPDMLVEAAEITVKKNDDRDLKEADLSGHLSNGNGDKNTGATKAAPKTAIKDHQLRQALYVLKGYALIDRKQSKASR